MSENPKATRDAKPDPREVEEWRKRYRAAADALMAYAHPSNWTRHRPSQPLSAETAIFLVPLVRELGAGRIPFEARIVATGHRPKDSPARIGAKATAVAYLGTIPKRMRGTVRKDVALTYRVTDRTIMVWQRHPAVKREARRMIKNMKSAHGDDWPKLILPRLMRIYARLFRHR